MAKGADGMRKTIYTLNVNEYAPEITVLTYPLLKLYARKCGAEFYVIGDRKFKDWPVTYEKLQIFQLAKKRKDDWSIYIDSDALVHPETIDWTNYLPQDTIAHNGVDMASVRWRYDEYFRRDGRNIGSCNWFAVASSWCRDLWAPLDITPSEAIDAIYPTVEERNTVITPEHLVDDFALSRNIARYGLKVKTLIDLQKEIIPGANFFWHAYVIGIPEKVKQIKQVISDWKLERYYD